MQRIPSVSSVLARGVNAANRSRDVLWGRSFPVWPVGGVARILDISMCDEEGISCKLPDNPYAEVVVQMAASVQRRPHPGVMRLIP